MSDVAEVNQRSAVADAVARARRAFEVWGTLPFAARAQHLLRVRDHLVERSDEVVDVICSSTGKLPAEAMGTEVVVSCELIGWYARHGERALRPERVRPPVLLAGKRAEIRYEPMGVVGVISPWNYPFTLAMSPVVTALFAGNAVVLKPSEFTPEVGLLVGRLFSEAGGHPDLVQVVTGGSDTGEALVRSGVEKIVFTGSVATGRKVMRAAADTLTPVVLELGGKDAMVVTADADVERAARAAVWGAFSNAGQTCMAVERAFVADVVYDAFVDRVVDLTGRLEVGRDLGRMIHDGQADIVQRHLDEAVAAGAKVAVGGHREGTRFEPTVLLDVDDSMAVMREETFGPLLPVVRVADEDEAVRRANQSPYGLNASVWTGDERRGRWLAGRLQSGSVCINDVIVSYAIPGLPYGGVKDSGFGRTHGAEGLREMSVIKAVALDRAGLRREPQWLPLARAYKAVLRPVVHLRYGRGIRRLKGLLPRRRGD